MLDIFSCVEAGKGFEIDSHPIQPLSRIFLIKVGYTDEKANREKKPKPLIVPIHRILIITLCINNELLIYFKLRWAKLISNNAFIFKKKLSVQELNNTS